MSMICQLRRTTQSKIDDLLKDPQSILFYLYGPLPEPKRNWFSRLFHPAGPTSKPAEVEWSAPSKDEILDLDKSWHGLHYLMTESDWEGDEPLCYLVKGGEPVGDVDMGYGPARALRPETVRIFSAAVASLSTEQLAARFNPQLMTELTIYPSNWEHESVEDSLSYIFGYLETLRVFLQETAKQKQGLIIYLS